MLTTICPFKWTHLILLMKVSVTKSYLPLRLKHKGYPYFKSPQIKSCLPCQVGKKKKKTFAFLNLLNLLFMLICVTMARLVNKSCSFFTDLGGSFICFYEIDVFLKTFLESFILFLFLVRCFFKFCYIQYINVCKIGFR